MNHDKLIEESQTIFTEKLGKELSKYKKTEQVPTEGETPRFRTYVDVPPEQLRKLSTKARAKLKYSKQRRIARRESELEGYDDSFTSDILQNQRVATTKARLRRHNKSRGVKTRGKANESLKSFNTFCEALKHVKGSKLSTALKQAEKQIKKSRDRQEALPPIDKHGNVSDKEWNKEENRQYRLERATEEVRGETAKRLRQQGMRPATNVSNIDREAEKGGDQIKPRAPKPTHSPRLPSGVSIINQKPKSSKKVEGKTKELGTGK